MKETLADIKSKLKSGGYRNEEHVRQSLVNRVLQKLDWDIWNPAEVNAEYVVVPNEDKTRVDLALFLRPELPSVFIEIKPVGQMRGRLQEIERQMRDYNRNNTALFSLITDGKEWRFYYSQTAGQFSQKCFAAFDIHEDDLEDIERSLLTFLKKSEIANGNARREAENYLQLSQMQRAMEDHLPEARRLVNEHPFPALPEALVNLVRSKGFAVTSDDAATLIKRVAERKPQNQTPHETNQPAAQSFDDAYRTGTQQKRPRSNPNNPNGLLHTRNTEEHFSAEPASKWKELADSPVQPGIFAGIACSRWSQAQRQALVMMLVGQANQSEHFVPRPWNRHAKARAALRELEKAGHLVRDGGRIRVIESSFVPLSTPTEK